MHRLAKIASGHVKNVRRAGIIAGAIFLLVIGNGTAFGAETPKSGLAVSPPTFELSANPGDVLKNSLRVDNIVDEPLEVTVDTRNFTALGEEGGINLSPAEDRYSLASWISVTPAKVVIPAGGSQTFDYTINIPADASPGGRFGSIIFKTALKNISGQTGVAVGQEVGTLVFVKIAGQVNEKASIASFGTKSGINERGPVDFDIRVKNEGNVQFKPSGNITITNFFGKKIATIPIDEQNVLPDAIRKMNASWKSDWLFGKYNATLSLVYGNDKQVLTASTTFWGFPYKMLAILLVVLAGATALIYPHRKRIRMAFKVLFGKQ